MKKKQFSIFWIQQQIEQEEIDRNDLQMFEQMNQQEQQDKEEQQTQRRLGDSITSLSRNT